MWGLVLRRFSRTCSSLMSFSPFSCFFSLLSLLVASSFFSSVEVLVRLRSFVCDVFGFLNFSWTVFHPALSTQLFVLSSLKSLDPFTFLFSARACSLAFLCLAILFFKMCRFFSLFLFIYLFLFLRLVLIPFSL